MVGEFEQKIVEVDLQIVKYVDGDVVDRLSSVPGVGFVSAAMVAAELGDVSRFVDERSMCGYCGITPSVWQRGKKRWNGYITKYGSKWLRLVLVQCALAAVKCRGDSCFKQFYLRVKARRGYGIVIVVLARKMLGVMYYLLVRGELFFEEELGSKRRPKVIRARDLLVPFEEAVGLLVKAGYVNGK
ncbi:MAG: transposase [Nitrososphaerota archaeon]|nr:transposase [Nitrososphaerota archaeon]